MNGIGCLHRTGNGQQIWQHFQVTGSTAELTFCKTQCLKRNGVFIGNHAVELTTQLLVLAVTHDALETSVATKLMYECGNHACRVQVIGNQCHLAANVITLDTVHADLVVYDSQFTLLLKFGNHFAAKTLNQNGARSFSTHTAHGVAVSATIACL